MLEKLYDLDQYCRWEAGSYRDKCPASVQRNVLHESMGNSEGKKMSGYFVAFVDLSSAFILYAGHEVLKAPQ